MPNRIAALLPFHNEIRYLPSWFESIGSKVDAVIALDDRSTDGSFDYVAAQPQVISIQRLKPYEGGKWNEPRNRQILITTGQQLDFDWFVAFDADERVDSSFWKDAWDIADRASLQGTHAFHFPLREMWNTIRHYRSDGIWGRKKKAVFFSNLGKDHVFDPLLWHGDWISLAHDGSIVSEPLPHQLYHLKMIREEDRNSRRERYKKLDPNREYQPIGYDYLTDEDGLVLTELRSHEQFEGIPDFLREPGG